MLSEKKEKACKGTGKAIGNETQYLINLPKRIGQDKFDELKRLADLDGSFNKHWTKEELSDIRKQARDIIKKL